MLQCLPSSYTHVVLVNQNYSNSYTFFLLLIKMYINYFKITLTCMFYFLAREALCEPPILNIPERVDWKTCKLSMDEEKEIAAKFKSVFKQFDFNFS